MTRRANAIYPAFLFMLCMAIIAAGFALSWYIRSNAAPAPGVIPGPTPEPTILPLWSRLVQTGDGRDWHANAFMLPDGTRLYALRRDVGSDPSWLILPAAPAPRAAPAPKGAKQ